MNPVVLAAALQAGSSLMTNISNVALSERQRNTSIEMQDKMNQYNSPEEQVKRMRAAGLNPNISNGQVIGANESAPYQSYQLPQLRDLMSDASNSSLTLAQAKTEDAMRQVRIEEAQANIDNLAANSVKLGLESENLRIVNQFAAAEKQAAIGLTKAQTRYTWADIRKVNQESRNLAYQLKNVLPAEVMKSLSESNVNVLRLDEILATIANIKASTEQTEAQTELIQSQTEGQDISNTNAQEIANQVIAQYKATIKKLAAETNKTEEEVFWMLFDGLDRNFNVSILGSKLPMNVLTPARKTVEKKLRESYDRYMTGSSF